MRHLPQSHLHFMSETMSLLFSWLAHPWDAAICAHLFLSDRCVPHCLLLWGWWTQISMLVSQVLYLKSHFQGYCYPVCGYPEFYISPSYIQEKLKSLLYFPLKFSAVANGNDGNKIAIIKQGMLWVLFVCFVFIIHVDKSCQVLEVNDVKFVAIYKRKGFIIFRF